MIAISSKLGDSFITVVENVEYNRADIKKYEEIFYDYKGSDTIRAESFYDKKWVIITGIEKYNIRFNLNEIELQFKIIQNNKFFSDTFSLEDLEISIKGFVLYQLRTHTSSSISTFCVHILQLFREGILSKKEIPDNVNNHFINQNYDLLRKYFYFIFQFYRNDVLLDDFDEKYQEYLVRRWERRQTGEDKRALPSMETMFKLNDIINTFIVSSLNEKDEKKKQVLISLKEKYFPIILWWKVTSIIPMRNSEFCVTPKNCIFKKDGIPYLEFRRSALKGGSTKPFNFDHSVETSYYIEKFPISNELYNLIDEYKNLVKKYDEIEDFYGDGIKGAINRKFLLSYRNYKMFCNSNNYHIEYDEIINADLLYSILNNFLVEYVVKELGLKIIPKSKEYDQNAISEYELTDISVMDTRHYAIMNLHFMGYESSTIQRIIGHERLDQQLSYFAHGEAFINCYVVSIAKEIAEKMSKQHKKDLLDMTFTDIFGKKGSGNERFEIVKNRELEDNLKTKQLDDGLCSYEHIESDTTPCRLYQGQHGMCPYFVGNTKGSLTLVNEAFQKVTTDISTELKILDDITRNKKQYTGDSIEQENVSKNKIMSWAQTKAQMISDFIINGVEMKG